MGAEQDFIVWIGSFIDGMVLGYLTGRASQLCAWLGVPATAALTIWGVYLSRGIGAGEVPSPLNTVANQAFQKAFVVAIATSFGAYQWLVIDTIESLAGPMVGFFVPSQGPMAGNASPWAAITGVVNQASDLMAAIARDHIDFTEWVVGTVAVVIVFLGTAAVALIALYVTGQAKVFRFFVMLLGPIFILFLMFKTTTGLFFSWLHMLLSMVVVTWVTYFVLGISLYMGQVIVMNANDGMAADNLLKMAVGYFIGMGFCAGLLGTAPSLAAALTGGTPMQLGSQLLTQMAMTYLMTQGHRGSPEAGSASNHMSRVPPGGAVPYAAGHAAGSAARWAYQRIANRGSRP